MLREIISRCKTIKYCADNFTQDFGLDLSLPIPVSIIGITLLLLLLLTKTITLTQIETISSFFLKNMGFFFIAAGVSILGKYYLIENILWQFSAIILVTTLLTFVVTALAVKYTMKLQQKFRKD